MIELANEKTAIKIAPEVGGRIVEFVDRKSGYDFLWRNPNLPLRREEPGAEYDPNFYGGIDELLPNDIPETVAGIVCPDHGELWTSEFKVHKVTDCCLQMAGFLPRFNLGLKREILLAGNECRVMTMIADNGEFERPFLWKLHVALAIQPGDKIDCAAKKFTAADPQWSRREGSGDWQGETVPDFDNTTEFLFLHELKEGNISWQRGNKKFEIVFDPRVFRYAWYFASYGGFAGHRVAILEPCTCMPISVNEAAELGQCSALQAGGVLTTTYIYRGTVDED